MTSAPAIAVYAILFVFPFIENIFPPSPSDLIILVGATLIGRTIDFIPALLLTSISSEIGFLFLYYLGAQTDRKLLRAGKLKFISLDALDTAEKWFAKYGFIIILFNRFISGIRSVIAFFAGVSELPLKRTIILSSISSVLWHLTLLTCGVLFARHIHKVDRMIEHYGIDPAVSLNIVEKNFIGSYPGLCMAEIQKSTG